MQVEKTEINAEWKDNMRTHGSILSDLSRRWDRIPDKRSVRKTWGQFKKRFVHHGGNGTGVRVHAV